MLGGIYLLRYLVLPLLNIKGFPAAKDISSTIGISTRCKNSVAETFGLWKTNSYLLGIAYQFLWLTRLLCKYHNIDRHLLDR